MSAPLKLVDTALEHAGEGFSVIPIQAGQKKPAMKGWQQWATTDAEKIRAHWNGSPQDNVGIACGGGLLVLDVDGEAGAQSLAALEAKHGKLPETCRVSTPGGGQHFYFAGPDVSNSVSVLGAHLDIRGRGGYVVAPGSRTEKGVYGVIKAAEPAPAPQWLLDLCSRPREKANTGAVVPDAAPSAIERARQWIAMQAPAVQGEGGDARTFATAAGLRDLGVSEAQALELLTEWNARCSPSWSIAELRTKASNAYRYATSAPGARAALPQDFPVQPSADTSSSSKAQPADANAKIRQPRAYLTTQDFAARVADGAGYVVKGLLSRNSYAVWYGSPGAGKTFTALDIAYAVAQGRDWMGRKVNGGIVVYVPFEGAGGLAKRVRALVQKYGHAPNFRAIENPDYNLRDLPGRQAFGQDMAAALGNDKPVLLVFDTLARCLKGGEENSAKDMGALNDALGALIENTGCCALLIHHSGKDKSAGARGSSALLGAIDTEILIDDSQIVSTKQRDVEISAPIGFKLEPVVVGVDADGDDIVSCTVEPAMADARTKRKPTGQALEARNALCKLAPDNVPVSAADWQSAFAREAWPTDPPKADGQRRAFQRAVKVLVSAGWVVDTGQGWQRPLTGGSDG